MSASTKKPAMRLALGFALLCLAACGGDDSSSYDPCMGKGCGESCNLCPPDDVDCEESNEIKVCSLGGECLVAEPVTCPTPGSDSSTR